MAQRVSNFLPQRPHAEMTRRRENTRAELVRASVQVFADKGLDGATIDDLVRAAGFTRGAFYSSFTSKEQLFGAAFALATDELIRIMHSTVRDERPPEGHLPHGDSWFSSEEEAAVVVSLFEAVRPFGRDWCLLHSEAVTQSLRSDSAAELLNGERAKLRDTVARTLRDGIHVNRARTLISLEDLAQLLISIFIDMFLREHLERAEVSELATTTILGTLGAFIIPIQDPGEPAGE